MIYTSSDILHSFKINQNWFLFLERLRGQQRYQLAHFSSPAVAKINCDIIPVHLGKSIDWFRLEYHTKDQKSDADTRHTNM